MKIAIIGGTGFVGSYLIQTLLEKGHTPRLLVRPGSEHKLSNAQKCETVSGSVDNLAALEKTICDCDAVIYNIGILREFPSKDITFEKLQFEAAKNAIDSAKANQVQRFILMSANGVKDKGTPYQDTKFRAEVYLKESGLDWTIFQPSVIFGDPQGKMEFASQLDQQMLAKPIPAPLFFAGCQISAAGQFQLSPVHVEDVAKAFVGALEKPESIGQTYPLGGPNTLTWKAILQTIAQAVGRKPLFLPAPAWGVKSAAYFFDRFEFFPITRDQIRMLMEGNVADGSQAFADFNIAPKPFNRENLAYLAT